MLRCLHAFLSIPVVRKFHSHDFLVKQSPLSLFVVSDLNQSLFIQNGKKNCTVSKDSCTVCSLQLCW